MVEWAQNSVPFRETTGDDWKLPFVVSPLGEKNKTKIVSSIHRFRLETKRGDFLSGDWVNSLIPYLSPQQTRVPSICVST